MDEFSSKLQLFHYMKILSMEEVKAVIEYNRIHSSDSKSMIVPYGFQINTTLTNSEPVQCTLYSESESSVNYIAFYGSRVENGLYSWFIEKEEIRKKEEIRIKKRRKKLVSRIINVIFIPASYLVFASCEDLTIRTYGARFQEQSKVQLEHSILCMKYNAQTNLVVTGCIGFIQQWELNETLHNKPLLVKETHLEGQISNTKPWINYLEFIEEKHLTVALTGNLIYFLNSTTLQTVMTLKNRHSFSLSTCLTYIPREYFLTGSCDGSIKVWNLSMNTCPYVGYFSGHTAKIIKLDIHPREDILISASEDSTIRLWRFETFRETHRFDVTDSIREVFLINSRLLYYTSKFSLHLLDLNLFHSLFTIIGSDLNKIQRIKSFSKPSRILATAEDGGVRIISPAHGDILTMLFPIVTHKVVSYHHDPIEEMLYVLLKEDKGVMLMSTQTNPCRATQLLCFQEKESAAVCLEIIYIEMEKKVIPLLLAAQRNGKISLLAGGDLKMNPEICNGGLVITITPCQHNSQFDFITCTSEYRIALWKFRKESPKSISIFAIHEFHVEESVCNIVASGNIIAFTSDRSIFLCKVVINKYGGVDISKITHTNDESHRAIVTELSACYSVPIFASASTKDGKIKIWDTGCTLVRELSFDETLSGMCFCNDRGDLLVGFQKNLHHVSVTEYMPQPYLEMLLTQNIEDDEIEYCTPFDPLLKFWYDGSRVSFVSIIKPAADENKEKNLKLRRLAVDQLILPKNVSAADCKNKRSVSRGRVIPTTLIKLREHKKNRSAGKKVITTKIAEESYSVTFEEKNIQKINEILRPEKRYWPFAPDGFIPNSIVRSLQKPAPLIDHTVKMICKQNVAKEVVFEETFGDFEDKKMVWDIADIDDYYESNTRNIFNIPGVSEEISKKQERLTELRELQDDFLVIEPEKKRRNKKKITGENKVIERVQKTKKHIKNVANLFQNKEIENVPLVKNVPPPYDKYIDKEWFPNDIGFDQNIVISYLIDHLNLSQPLTLKEILAAIATIHSYHPMSDELYERFIQVLLSYLENPAGQIRHYAVTTLLALCAKRRDVILKLIPKLKDPVSLVKDAVKNTLQQVAGIKDADTLAAVLRSLGEMKENITSSDKDVIESFKEAIIFKKGSFRKHVQSMRHIGNQISANMCDSNKLVGKEFSNKPVGEEFSNNFSSSDDITKIVLINDASLDNQKTDKKRPQKSVTQKLRSKKKPQKKLNDNQIVKYNSKSLLEVKEQKNISGNKIEVKNEEGAPIKLVIKEAIKKEVIKKEANFESLPQTTTTTSQTTFPATFPAENNIYFSQNNERFIKSDEQKNANEKFIDKSDEQNKANEKFTDKSDKQAPSTHGNENTFESNNKFIREDQKEFLFCDNTSFNDSRLVKKIGPLQKNKDLFSNILSLFKKEDIWHLNRLLLENAQETAEHVATRIAKKLYKKFEVLKSEPDIVAKTTPDSFLNAFRDVTTNIKETAAVSNADVANSSNISALFKEEYHKGLDTSDMKAKKKFLTSVDGYEFVQINSKMPARLDKISRVSKENNQAPFLYEAPLKTAKDKPFKGSRQPFPNEENHNTNYKQSESKGDHKSLSGIVFPAADSFEKIDFRTEQTSDNDITNGCRDDILTLLKLLRKAQVVRKEPSAKFKKGNTSIDVRTAASPCVTLSNKKIAISKTTKLFPSLSYKVFGTNVCGERILNRLEMLPMNYRFEACTKIIKSIPERYGCQIVSIDSGVTKYGSLGLYWNALLSNYNTNSSS